MIKIIYHKSDLDGKCSAAIAKIWCENNCVAHKLIPADYGDSYTESDEILSEIVHGDTVFILDFSFSIETMKLINVLCHSGNFVWIDHHQSKIVDAEKQNFCPEGIRRVGTAACELCMEYFFPKLTMSRAVHYLGRYDVWDHYNPDILAFQYGMLTSECDPNDSTMWRKLITIDEFSIVDNKIEIGKKMLSFVTERNKAYASHYAFETEFEGYRAIAINTGMAGSIMFDSVYNKDAHDIMIAFAKTQLGWCVTLYCDKPDVNVGEIAKKYGGGGHKGAAGFNTKKLPLLLD